ncbi:MAG: hypothetical protein R3B54_17810 [Bdellovibrionota bacterium]
MGYRTLWPHRKDPSRMYPSGLFVAVKDWQVKKAEFYPFGDSARAGNEKLLDNGTLMLELRSQSGSPLILAAVHLQALTVDKAGKALKPEEVAAFEKQVELTKEKIKKWAGEELPTLVVGDLNVGPVLGADNYKKLMASLDLKNAFFSQALPPTGATWDQKNKLVADGDFSTDPSDMVDHVLYSGEKFKVASASVVLKETLPNKAYPLSDHYGLLVEFQQVR